MALSFRTAGHADVGAIVALVESAYRGESSRQGWTTEADLLEGQRTDPAAVGEIIDSPGSRILIAERGGQIVGCCQVESRSQATAYLGLLAVRPGLHGQGLGRAVIAEAERSARVDGGAERMEMTVIRQRADLIAWYERLGYRPTGETKPFPYGDERFGLPTREDLEFVVLARSILTAPTSSAVNEKM